jgi:hypothetical protein
MSRWALDPVPESCGLLEKPPRVPPTAIGVATPPPPDRYPRRLGPTRRIALAFLGIVLAMATLPLVSSPTTTTRTTVGASLIAASVDVGLQAATATTHPWREIVAPAALRAFQSAAALPQTLALRRVLLHPRRARGSRDSQRLIE